MGPLPWVLNFQGVHIFFVMSFDTQNGRKLFQQNKTVLIHINAKIYAYKIPGSQSTYSFNDI